MRPGLWRPRRALEAERATRQTRVAELRGQLGDLEAEKVAVAQRLVVQLVSLIKLRVSLLLGLLTGTIGRQTVRDRPPWKLGDVSALLARSLRVGARGLDLGLVLLRIGWLLAIDAFRPGVRRTVSAKAAPSPVESTQEISCRSARPGSMAYDVIVFPIIDWEFRFQRPQQLAVQFARAGHRVFYARTTFREGSEMAVSAIEEGVFAIQFPGAGTASIYTGAMDGETVRAVLDAFRVFRDEWSIGAAVCIVDLPFWGPVAVALREAFGWKVVYDCMDHHAGFSTNASAMLAQEEQLSRRSDLVITTSHMLFKEHAELNPNCLVVPNATDFDHFRFVPSPAPRELADLKGPIIGYYGAISDWFDSKLVGELAAARPDWTFVLIGRTFGADEWPFEDAENVLILEEKAYGDLPSYLKAFDVCIIPFKKTPLTEATNPVKLFEFLSAGKSVVATRLAELEQFEEYVELASTPEEWLAGIERALGDHAPGRVAARWEFARRNTWEARFRVVHDAIRGLYGKVSIIVVTYNNIDYNRLCLESIYRNTQYPHFEVIVVDNASTDGTRALLETWREKHENMNVVLRDANEGFARANNLGLEAATGEYVVLLNNDTAVTPRWLGKLIGHLGDRTVGMVGPVTNFSGNESRIPVSYRTLEEMERFAEEYSRRHEGERFEIPMLPLFCAALRRSTMNAIGPLDERFGVGMFEDDDYAMRVKQAGLKVVCAEDTFVHHWGRASFRLMQEEDYRRLFEENRRQFEEKWQMRWKAHKGR